jgi:hypothetical protein
MEMEMENNLLGKICTNCTLAAIGLVSLVILATLIWVSVL